MTKLFSTTPTAALNEYFPEVPAFRDCQEEALNRIRSGHSCLILMPTGTGKSLVYQLPVFASGKIGIIISPLIALMQQQANTLREMGANVLSLGGAEATEAQKALKGFPWAEGAGFIFVSPERAETDGYLEYLVRQYKEQIALVAIDESHCISQWGHDFRPPYKNLPGILDRCFGRDLWPTLLCLTATLDENSQNEILRDFRMTSSDIIRSTNMLRTNLDLRFEVFDDGEAKLAALKQLLEEYRDEKLIVYAHRKRSKTQGTRALAEQFADLGHKCAPFDADLPMDVKEDTLARFEAGDVRIVFATGAFGMGVDIPDIRGVIHFLLPESLEQYYQEVGRAGRDGEPAFGTLLYTAVNSKVRRDMIEKGRRAVDQVREVWNQVCNIGRSELKTISPWSEFQGRDDEYALFYAFQRIGAINLLARGPGRLQCFEPRGPEGMAFLERLNSATRNKTTAAAIRKLGIDPGETIEQMFELFHRQEIKLVRAPDKTLFFRTRDIRDEELQQISDEIEARIDSKLDRFQEFVDLIEAGADPTEALTSHFGARFEQKSNGEL